MKLSIIVITRNEEEMIKDCLSDLKFGDEIIIIDNGSTDETLNIAKKFKCTIFKVRKQKFDVLRNFGKEKARGEWLLYIDADERVSRNLKDEIKEVLKDPKDFNAYQIIRQNYYLGKLWPKKENMIRLMKKDSLIKWHGIIHETPAVEGRIGSIRSHLLHYTHRNIGKMVDKTNEWSEYEADLRFRANHPMVSWWRFFRMMITEFYNCYFKQEGWKAGTEGLIESIYQAFSVFITYAKLWEKQTSVKR